MEVQKEKVSKYVNGLDTSIQDEIHLLHMHSMQDVYQLP